MSACDRPRWQTARLLGDGAGADAAAWAGELSEPVTGDQAEQLEQLNGGWPFGPGPDEWVFTVQWREGTETGSQGPGPHLCCRECGQSVTRLGKWAHTLASLKPQIAAHVMQVHLAQVVR